MSDRSFLDVVTIVESEYIAPETMVIIEGPFAFSSDEVWVKARTLNGDVKIIRLAAPKFNPSEQDRP